ncbi:uncharacterized protein LOC106142326 isoform X2 [Amyelois transitella]|uniref:uncharacterized protein LOC106142326 isoform X2 n=1 Tax=Amyelois transitella TaxID=680683 RepID=UPI00298FE0A9|nr:uncharacterized protein LOC106142326 isoform X2 [Amyelois transitella]
MAYNRQYKARQSGRYNTPGQFVPAESQQFGQQQPQPFGQEPFQQYTPQPQQNLLPPQQNVQPAQQTVNPVQQNMNPVQQNMNPVQQNMNPVHQNVKPVQMQQNIPNVSNVQPNSNMPQIKTDLKAEPDTDVMMESVQEEEAVTRPAWMKSKIPGMKKISKRERRRRQNNQLRRLIAPKNALMVLNEWMLSEQIANNFKVEPAPTTGYYKNSNKNSFCADLTLDGQTYKGYGENKLAARNAAAEQAIRDLIIKRLARASSDGNSDGVEGTDSEESLPMIQIASFALHKLFSEWEYEGHKVPQIRPLSISQSSDAETEAPAPSSAAPRPPPAKKPKEPKELPLNAPAMHPAMLLGYMRPNVEYRELQVEGDRPQNMVFTVGVEVEGSTFVGKASNKKEARKAAARAACSALFGVAFHDVCTANAPVAPASANTNTNTANTNTNTV